VILYGTEYWGGLIDWLRGPVQAGGKVRSTDLDLIYVSDDVDQIVARIVEAAQERSAQQAAEERAVAAVARTNDVR
jgi:predicted Rossmann-fold nucleotide-binding protein